MFIVSNKKFDGFPRLAFFTYFQYIFSMKNWTDKHIKKHIEELIEESYILSLTPVDLEKYIHDFIQSSEAVLRRNAFLLNEVKITRLKIALLRAHLLEYDIGAVSGSGKKAVNAHGETDTSIHEKTIRLKRIIMVLLEDVDHNLAMQVIQESKKRAELASGDSKRLQKLKSIAIGLGFYGLIGMALILLWIVISF